MVEAQRDRAAQVAVGEEAVRLGMQVEREPVEPELRVLHDADAGGVADRPRTASGVSPGRQSAPPSSSAAVPVGIRRHRAQDDPIDLRAAQEVGVVGERELPVAASAGRPG